MTSKKKVKAKSCEKNACHAIRSKTHLKNKTNNKIWLQILRNLYIVHILCMPEG